MGHEMSGSTAHRVVVIGGGFAGLFAVRRLRRAPVQVTLIDRATHHLFQPLLYQVATGILSEGEVAPALRDVLRHQRNAEVLLGEVTDIDLAARKVTSRILDRELVIEYDSLIVAAGGQTSYFGHDEFAVHAPGLKTVDDALELRGRIFGAFELAEIEEDLRAREEWMTFVIVGAGATGVELTGQIAELARSTLKSNFRHIDPAKANILLLEALPTILPQFNEHLARRATDRLKRAGVDIRLGLRVTGVDERGLDVTATGSDLRRIDARTKIWAAGVSSSPLGATLAAAAGVKLDRGGRVPVESNCSLPGHPDVFVVGDMMSLNALPGVAEVALQSGRHAAAEIVRHVREPSAVPAPFKYHDLGTLAAISKNFAIAQRGTVRFAGFAAWLVWLFVHLTFLTGFKNRVTTLIHWVISFIGRGRAERTITVQEVLARRALQAADDNGGTGTHAGEVQPTAPDR
jgi:NADH:ubiquinone reductase (H+-translocating)